MPLAIIGSIIGVGLATGTKTFDYKLILKIVFGWIGTPLASGLISVLLIRVLNYRCLKKILKCVNFFGQEVEKLNKYILSIDQGTTSSRAIIFDHEGNIVNSSQREFSQLYPKPGWVEHNPDEIWGTTIGVIANVLGVSNIQPEQISAIGITNQRETTIIWDAKTGEPVYNAIVWQDRRTSSICDGLREKGYEELIRNKTGLLIDAYFSGTKIKWILDNVEGVRKRAENGELRFGTVDSWIIWKLTRGKVHVTDYTNASRTMIYNIFDLKWDDDLLNMLDIPRSLLPVVKESSEIYGYTDSSVFGANVPISGIAGDQQAATFGQLCFEKGMAKILTAQVVSCY